MPLDAVVAYAERHDLHALLVADGWTIALERYGVGWDAETPHPLYSGTKSFWGLLAVALAEDGLLSLDAPVVQTLHEFGADPQKRTMTVRQLLNLTSGYGFGGLGRAVPLAAKAIATPLKHDPGTTFTYGGVPLQVFGEVVRRTSGREPHDALRERILDPLGVRLGGWRTLSDGTRPLPTGAELGAREWLRYGTFLLNRGAIGTRRLIQPSSFAACLSGSPANPSYGLGIWLGTGPGETPYFYASGSGGQALYVVPARNLVAVHFGASASWRHESFVRALLT